MSLKDKEGTLIWVCVHCYFAHHGALEDGDPDHVPDKEPLNLIDDTDEVTAGLLWEEHDEECANRKAEEWVEECGCEEITFTWSWCQGCGSHLGGSRHALTIWYPSSAGTRARPNKAYVLALMRDFFDNDLWGTAMGWAWGVVECIYDADPNLVPSELGYSPGMGGPEVPTAIYHDTGEPMGDDVSHETSFVWDWLHAEHAKDPQYFADPTFEARLNELVFVAKCLHRYIDWCKAAGLDY